MRDIRLRQSGFAAVVGGVLIVMLTLLETYAFHDGTTIGWVVAARPIMEPIVSLTRRYVTPDEVLYVFGRPQGLAFLLLLLEYVGLHARLSRYASRIEAVGYRLAVLALMLAFVGNIGDMWLGKHVWGTSYQWVAQLGGTFLILGAILLSVSSILIGISILRTNVLPHWTAWILLITSMLSLPTAFVILQGLSAVYLPFGLAWIVLGYVFWTSTRENEVLVQT